MNVLAGCDFFTVELLSWRGLVTYYVDPAANAVHRRESCRRVPDRARSKMIFGLFDDRAHSVHNVMRQSIPGNISGTGTGS
jgi:hypothetical protein